MTDCPECGEPGGAHAAGCTLAAYDAAPVPVPAGGDPPPPDLYGRQLEEIRDDVRALRRMAAFALVLLVLWMLVWAVVNGA